MGCSNDEQHKSSGENTSNKQESEPEAATTMPMEEPEVIADNLKVPWSIEKFENTFFVTERPGNIVKINNGEMVRQQVMFDKELSTAAEAGLLGFELAPDFSESKTAYAYYTYKDNTGQFNRIVTLRLENNIWKEESLLLDHIPSGAVHHGGRLEIGPDEKLYATTGDAHQSDNAQDLDSLGGKILRMNLNGSIPEDNPYSHSYVYSYGHRNPQGMTWTPDGTMYASEHGNDANDEINKIEAGKNYGWPVIEGREEREDMVSPLFTSGENNTWAPSGIDNNGNQLYTAALRGTAVLAFDLETGKQKEVITEYGRIRDVLIEENNLFFISNNTDGRGTPQGNDDKLYKILLTP
ncbi:PQQ-dependent sugar dehydrogenase [Alteribacillus iranensis]|nr:PQQ-dependent sugar dehydrogenase [Alteribacillus iranensis]